MNALGIGGNEHKLRALDMTTETMSDGRTRKSFLIQAVSIFMFVGGISSIVIAFSDPARELGTFFQVSLLVAAIWTLVAASGIWMHRRWGAYLYLALIVVSQVFLGLFNLWTWATPIIPLIILLLLFVGFRRLPKST